MDGLDFGTGGSRNQYDDNGSLVVNQVSLVENGIYSENVAAATIGAIASMYDVDPTTYYLIAGVAAEVGPYYVKWDMRQKTKFKNIYAYVGLQSNAVATCKLQGSNDNANWTDLDTATGGAAVEYSNLVASNVSYRYIRLYFTTTGHFDTAQINSIKAVT